MARPTVTASSSLAAPITSIAMALLAPSASCCICRARSAQAPASSAANSAGSGRTPEAPLASSSTVSLVDMQPSVSSRSNVVAHRAAQRGVQLAGRQVGVGGEHDQHGGQRRGQHGGALGHAADRRSRCPATAQVLGTVSVVRMASAAAGAAVRGRRGHRGVDPGQQLVHGQPLADQAGRADGDLARADSPAGRAR